MNPIEKFFWENEGGQILKWTNYFDIYQRHFSRFRNTDVHVVEIGVWQGGSLRMWKDYFGPKAKVYGVDINPSCKQLEEDQIEIFIGDQQDRRFLQKLASEIPRIDIVIDDGGHYVKQQKTSYEELFPYISENGVYLCEDLHSSYNWKTGGGYKRRGSFIEYSKNFIDSINAWHSRTRRLKVSDFTRSVQSVHYYSGVIVIEKQPMEKPYMIETGVRKIPVFQYTKMRRLLYGIRQYI